MILLLAFLNTAALDLAWVGYNRSTAQGRKAWGVAWAMGLALLSGVNAIAIVGDAWNLIGSVLGAGAGTLAGMYLSPWLERRRGDKPEVPTTWGSLALDLAINDTRQALFGTEPLRNVRDGLVLVTRATAPLWERGHSPDTIREHAIQLAAAALAIATQCCGEERPS